MFFVVKSTIFCVSLIGKKPWALLFGNTGEFHNNHNNNIVVVCHYLGEKSYNLVIHAMAVLAWLFIPATTVYAASKMNLSSMVFAKN